MRINLSYQKNGQKGISLLETMVSVGILGVFASSMLSTMEKVTKETKIVSQSSSIFESDQMVRYSISDILSRFQMNLIRNRTSTSCGTYQLLDQNNQPLLDSKGKPLTITPWTSFKKAQHNFLFSKEIYFGDFNDLKNENIPTFKNEIMPVFEDIIAHRTESEHSKKLINAYKRCESQTVKSNTTSMVGRTSFYVCGFGPGILVEAKVAFWDFFMNNEIKCESMIGNSGRGLQIVYSIYSFRKKTEKSLSYDGKKTFSYYVKSYDSLIFLPKRIDNISD